MAVVLNGLLLKDCTISKELNALHLDYVSELDLHRLQ